MVLLKNAAVTLAVLAAVPVMAAVFSLGMAIFIAIAPLAAIGMVIGHSLRR